MSDETETSAPPRRFQMQAPYAQVRVPNRYLRVGGIRTSHWAATAMKQYAIITEGDIHPDDLAHLLEATFEVHKYEADQFGAKRLVKEKQPFLVELPPG